MVNPRQPIDTEREDLTRNRLEDTPAHEAGPLELDDEDLETSEDDFIEDEDEDY